MHKRTKIIATIGPASQDPTVLEELIGAGVDVFRINFSHADKSFIQTVQAIRKLSRQLQRPVAIMADLQGPKIRIGKFQQDSIYLQNDQIFTLDCKEENLGDEKGVSVDYPRLSVEVVPGDHLLLDDGLLELKVKEVEGSKVICTVIEGGKLSNNKGINRKGGGLSAATLTEKDKEDMAAAVKAGVDYMSLSFVKNAEDIHYARGLLCNLEVPNLPIIAKIERTEALENLTAIIQAADVIMVARGDLGVEVGAAEIPAIQKHIIEQTRRFNKIVITATQMMESMIYQPQPTRAEVSDVANAILDGTDAVMLSAETAKGKFPVKVIQMVTKICLSAEKHASLFYSNTKKEAHLVSKVDQAIAMATIHCANHFNVQAIIALTESGATPIWISRYPSAVPIYAITENEETVCKLSLVNNVNPLLFDYSNLDEKNLNQQIIQHMKDKGFLTSGNHVLLTRGTAIGCPGGTNSLEIVKV
jgi:pyruvate kinase